MKKMNVSAVFACAAALAVLALAPAAGRAADLKTDLSFTFGDDNVLRGPGETRKNSPSAFFGNGMSTPLDRSFPSEIRDSVMLLSMQGAIKSGVHFVPEGGLLLKLNLAQGAFKDYGTFMRLNYIFDPVAQDRKVYLDLYPTNSNSMRLGFMDTLTWGTEDAFPRNFRSGSVPGVKLGYASKRLYGFVGMKTALVRSPAQNILYNPGGNTNKYVEQAQWGGLAGLGLDFAGILSRGRLDGLWLEVNGGAFQKGNNTRANVLGKPIVGAGASARLSLAWGLPIGEEVNVRYFFADPLRYDVFKTEDYDKGWSFFAGVEGTILGQTLEDPDRIHSTKNEFSRGAGVTLRAKYRHARFHLLGTVRDLTFLLFNVPGFVPYQALPKDVQVTPEISGAASLDLHIPSLNLTPSITAAVILPATYQGVVPEGQSADDVSTGIRKVVVMGDDSANWSILPEGEDELPVFLVRADLKWNFTKDFAVIAEGFYERDANLAQVFQDQRGHAIRTFDKPDILGFSLIARMSF